MLIYASEVDQLTSKCGEPIAMVIYANKAVMWSSKVSETTSMGWKTLV